MRSIEHGRAPAVVVLAWLVTACMAGADLPGAPPAAPDLPLELRKRIAAALTAKGTRYVPRTRHLDRDGRPRYTNRLILESSPYLLQHAHNPVNWYPWGDEAFRDAERLGRPILLSIGYSTCHWCHVMEEESFEDEEIAAYLNANYVPIKVDREERPDLDAIYMKAVNALTGRGGWPMTTWLTPSGQPFFGGTYFPARDGERGSRTGFLTLLKQLKNKYDSQPETIVSEAGRITERIRRSMAAARASILPDQSVIERGIAQARASFDPVDGGRRGRPKFPSSFPIRFLLGQWHRTGDEQLREMASLTLSKMANGGIHDQVGGGFHRYSVDSKWLVPHFEKMLYDNALLVMAYLDGYQATGNEDFSAVARRTLEYVAREMTSHDGAFYSATDADSRDPHGEMEEGRFFTWTPAELGAVLGPEASARLEAFYGVSPGGNFDGRNIFHVQRPKDEVARLLGLSVERLDASLARSLELLYSARANRPPPLRDEKILTSWNGLMISAMARGGFVLREPQFVDRAGRAAEFLLQRARRDGRLLRSVKDGEARHNAYLDDYAFLIAGLLDLYEVTWEPGWLAEALALQDVLDEHYQDSTNGGYFMTSDDHEILLAREKPAYDGAEPSGNSVAVTNLLRFHEMTSDDRFRVAGESVLAAFGDRLRQAPAGLSEMLLALDFWLDRPKQIVIVTPAGTRDAGPFLNVLRRNYVPNKIVTVVSQRKAGKHAGLVPLTQGKVAREGRTTAYVCEEGICKLPTTDIEVFSRQLERESPSPDSEIDSR